jgi:hypothetical protein
VIDDRLLDETEVAPLVGGPHATLVHLPQVRAGPGDLPGVGVVHEPLVERLRGRAAGEGQLEVPEAAHARLGLDDQLRRQHVEEPVGIGGDDDVAR